MDGHSLPVATATKDDDEGGHVALFRKLADGRRHLLADLATDGIDAVVDDLALLGSLGLPMQRDAVAVQAPRCVPLNAEAIRNTFRERDARWQVDVAFAVDSTNTELLRRVKQDCTTPCVLAAEVQRAGRGRLGRAWSSAPGASVTASFACRIARTISTLDGVTLVCGLAVRRVLATLGQPVQLKWPNDLLVDGRKLVGILVEAHARPPSTVLAIGIGINVAFDAPAFARPFALHAANLAASQESVAVDRNRLIADLARSLDACLDVFEADGFGAFVDEWNAADAFIDCPVRVESPPAPALAGIARGVDDHGALMLDVDGSLHRIIVGDVSLRPIAASAGPA